MATNRDGKPVDFKYQYIAERTRKEQRHLSRTSSERLQKELAKVYRIEAKQMRSNLNEVFTKILLDKRYNGEVYANDYFRTVYYADILNEFQTRVKSIEGQTIDLMTDELSDLYVKAKNFTGDVTKGIITQTFNQPELIDVKQAVTQAWCLDGKDLYTRIGTNSQKAIDVLTKELYDVATTGKSAQEMAFSITDKLGVPLKKAYDLARTECNHMAVTGTAKGFIEKGFSLCTYYAGDCCEECAQYDGQEFTLEQIQLMIPNHPNCNCSYLLEPIRVGVDDDD